MSDFKPGLEGVIAFETEIAEPDKEGGALRYRGVDIEDLIGQVSFGNVWALLVDGKFGPGLPPAEPFPVPVHSGDIRVDVQSAVAMLAPVLGPGPAARHLRRAGPRGPRPGLGDRAVASSRSPPAGSACPAVPQKEIDKAQTIVERFMKRWRGEPDPRHVKAVDAYFISAAEHGMNASTFTARVVASTGADAAACISSGIGALSGPLHGGAPSRVLHMIEARRALRRRRGVRQGRARPGRAADGLRPPGLPGRGPARPRAAAHRQGAGRAALRGGRGAGEGRAGGAARPQARPGAGHQRRVLVGRRAGLRRGPGAHVHLDVHLRPGGRLERAHPGAEEAAAGWSARRRRTSARPPQAAARSRAGTPSPTATTPSTRCVARDVAGAVGA